MEYHPSYTAEITSNLPERVTEVIRKSNFTLLAERINHLEQLIDNIADLESRGLIKRQQYYAPTTADFERQLARSRKSDKAL